MQEEEEEEEASNSLLKVKDQWNFEQNVIR